MNSANPFGSAGNATFGRVGWWSRGLAAALVIEGLGSLRHVAENPVGAAIEVTAGLVLAILFLLAGNHFVTAAKSETDSANASMAAVTSMGKAFRWRLVITIVAFVLAVVASGVASAMSG